MNKEKLKFNIAAIITEPGSSIKNKTGGWRTLKPVIDRDKCIKCGKCWQQCPDTSIKIDKEGKATIDYDFCKGCGICAAECPVKCIQMIKEEK
ncbi:4Fe-4S binding protein [Candidatus Woesearchaeota archaeon]|nr:4Fe-4S binding protein [Candidatus Woesearchaeota archaeon]